MLAHFKFNAWDIKRRKMIYNVAVYHDCSIGFTADTARSVYGEDYNQWPGGERVSWLFMAPSEVAILQSSGLPDKKGNIFYQGHIVADMIVDNQEKNEFRLEHYQIVFQNGCFGWLGEINGEFHSFSEDPLSDCEIVGNIFENLELIKKKQDH
jgi:hypothetical protein